MLFGNKPLGYGAKNIVTLFLRTQKIKISIAIFSTQSAKKLSADLSQQLSAQLRQMQALGDEIEQSQQRLSQDQALMSTEELQAAQQSLQEKTLEYRKLQEYVNRAKQQNEQALLQTIRPKLDAAMKKYIEANAVDLVINANAAVYVIDSLDITNQITQVLDQE